jgi:hypothetical protein
MAPRPGGYGRGAIKEMVYLTGIGAVSPVVALVVTSVEELAAVAGRYGSDAADGDDDGNHSGGPCPPMSAEGRPRVVLFRDGVVTPCRGLAVRPCNVLRGAGRDADREHDVLLVEMELLLPITIRVRAAEVIRRNTYLLRQNS